MLADAGLDSFLEFLGFVEALLVVLGGGFSGDGAEYPEVLTHLRRFLAELVRRIAGSGSRIRGCFHTTSFQTNRSNLALSECKSIARPEKRRKNFRQTFGRESRMRISLR